jgi:20S proteasome alpha/beta subunit
VNSVIEGIAEAIRVDRHESEEPTFGCELILCGFDTKKKPYILTLTDPGACTDTTQTGFSTIGSGSEHALKEMFDNEWERKFSLDRALYDILDAKIEAEEDDNVGYNWDAVILTADASYAVPQEVKTMMDRAWIMLNRSPYHEFNAAEDQPLPEADWKVRLKKYTDGLLSPPK